MQEMIEVAERQAKEEKRLRRRREDSPEDNKNSPTKPSLTENLNNNDKDHQATSQRAVFNKETKQPNDKEESSAVVKTQ